jgi:glyoxylase-like metal-dependent hydrolase (beta-lactamase superfamily II)
MDTNFNIKILDLEFLDTKETIAAYLIQSVNVNILVETGPHSTLDALQQVLANHNVDIHTIQHIFITHIHLDHAGAAWWFAQNNNAKIYLHPLGIKHLSNPEKLIQSATMIYGDRMDALWGKLKPIEADNLVPIAHNEVISINKLNIKALHTPGHAIHHIAWQLEDNLFAGDVAGIKIKNGPVVPPCPPPDIHIENWKESLALIKLAGIKKMYLTHYGLIEDVDDHIVMLSQNLDRWANWIQPHFEKKSEIDFVVEDFKINVRNYLKEFGLNETELKKYENANPAFMSVNGLLRYFQKYST